MISGWHKTDNKWYYVDKTGKVLTGWKKLKWSKGTDWFCFSPSGVMLTGWHKLRWSKGADWFYFDDNTGAMLTGFHELVWNGKKGWYYFDSNGAMKIGNVKMKVMFNQSGQMTGGKGV